MSKRRQGPIFFSSRRRLVDEAHAYVTDPRPSRSASPFAARLRRLSSPVIPPATLDAMLLEGAPTVRDLEALLADVRAAGGHPASVRRPPTRREAEVLALVADGCTTREIAARLMLSDCTVRRHIRNVRSKLGVTSRAAAVAAGVELRII